MPAPRSPPPASSPSISKSIPTPLCEPTANSNSAACSKLTRAPELSSPTSSCKKIPRARSPARPDGWRIRCPRRRRRIHSRRSARSTARFVAGFRSVPFHAVPFLAVWSGTKEIVMARIRITEVSGIARLLFAISLVIGLVIARLINNPAPAVVGALVGLYFLFAIKVVQQWEKVAVLRLGRYVGLRGPGLCHIIPIIETLSPYVDQRVRVASVSAESTLTRDTVPVT